MAEQRRISKQRLENLFSRGYVMGEPHPEGNMATPAPLMGPNWHPTQMRGPYGTPVAPHHVQGMAVASHYYVNGMVIYQQPSFGAPIQGQFGPFYHGPQPFMVPMGFQHAMVYPHSGPNLNPNLGSASNPGTFGANSGQSLGSSTHSSPDLSRRSIATPTTPTTTSTSPGFKAMILTGNSGSTLNPNSGSAYIPGTFRANSGQSLGSCTSSSTDLSLRSIGTTTTTTTTTTSTSFKATIVTNNKNHNHSHNKHRL